MVLGTVWDNIYKTRGFSIDFGVFVDNDHKPKNQSDGRFKNNGFFRIQKDGVHNNLAHVYMDSYRNKILSFKSSAFDEEERTTKVVNKANFTTKKFPELIVALDTVNAWMKAKEFEYLFIRGKGGKIESLGPPPPFRPYIKLNMSGSQWIQFTPSVVKDENGYDHEGVAIVTQSGNIVSMPHYDIVPLTVLLRDWLRNHYSNTMNLVTTATILMNSNRM